MLCSISQEPFRDTVWNECTIGCIDRAVKQSQLFWDCKKPTRGFNPLISQASDLCRLEGRLHALRRKNLEMRSLLPLLRAARSFITGIEQLSNRRLLRYIVVSLILVLLLHSIRVAGCDDPPRVGTFNIENYPKSARQTELVFTVIDELGFDALAVQEITDPRVFAREARRRLGRSYRFVYNRFGPKQRLGVLFNTKRFKLLSTRIYRKIRIDGRGKPAFEARLRPGNDGEVMRLIVVHLKSGSDYVDLRRRQLRALRPIVMRGVRAKERVILLGDFNATSDEDRQEIAALAKATRMTWASREVECTSYWDRQDGCRGTTLDHVLMWEQPEDVTARGACETEGCELRDRCPAFHRDISDHCPLTIDL